MVLLHAYNVLLYYFMWYEIYLCVTRNEEVLGTEYCEKTIKRF